jgi:O-antigen ligase
MGIRIDKPLKQQLIFLSMILMLLGLFTSRALLSVSLICFLLLTCIHKNFISQSIAFLKNPLLIGMSLLFFIPFISWFWTEDKNMWLRFSRIKLPLFLLPLAFAGDWQLSPKQWKGIAYSFLILVLAGCGWSLWQYTQNVEIIHREYLKAKVLPTPLDNDHVRFSLLVAIAIISCVVLIREVVQRNIKIIIGVACSFFIVYLHILSARTGLLVLYIFLIAGIVYLIIASKKRALSVGLLFVLIAMPLIAWFFFPTFQNRIRYNLYDLTNIRNNTYVPGANDGNRILSLKAGWQVLKEHPFGAGADVVNETYNWYNRNIPQMQETDRLFPSSELLMYAGFAGWPGLILFFAIMLLPFFTRIKRNYFFWVMVNMAMALSFLFDIGLEAQFGVFIYGFIVLWWWKWFNQAEKK